MPCLALRSQAFLVHEMNQVAHAAGVSPLIVVPGDDFHAIAADHARERRVHNGGTIVATVIDRHQLFSFHSQNSFHGAVGGGHHGGVHFFHGGVFFHEDHQVHHGH